MQELARSYQDDMREKILGFKFYAKECSITFIILRQRKNKANYEIKTKILILYDLDIFEYFYLSLSLNIKLMSC